MPRIPEQVIRVIAYLYPNKDAAKAMRDPSGTAFLVHLDADLEGWKHVYAVSCRHAIQLFPPTALRIEPRSGPARIYTVSDKPWTAHSAANTDLAIVHVGMLLDEDDSLVSLPIDALMTSERVDQLDVGPGTEVYAVGMFAPVPGVKADQPAPRFGFVSVMNASITGKRGHPQQSMLLELHSRPGFSGSPVFIHRRADEISVLGVIWSTIPDPLISAPPGRPTEVVPHMEVSSGMAGALPAWLVLDLLYSDEVRAQRLALENEKREPIEHESLEAAYGPNL